VSVGRLGLSEEEHLQVCDGLFGDLRLRASPHKHTQTREQKLDDEIDFTLYSPSSVAKVTTMICSAR
jgi:hypothetical protein